MKVVHLIKLFVFLKAHYDMLGWKKADIWFCCLATTMLWCKHECASMPRTALWEMVSLLKWLYVHRDKGLNLNPRPLDWGTTSLTHLVLRCYTGTWSLYPILRRLFWNSKKSWIDFMRLVPLTSSNLVSTINELSLIGFESQSCGYSVSFQKPQTSS